MLSAAEKDGVNRLLISLLPPGCSPHEVILLPDSVVRVLQENGTRRFCGGDGADGDEELEVDIYTLGDDALRAIKDCVGAYLEGRTLLPREEEAPSQSKEGVIGLTTTTQRSRTASKSIPSRAASKSILPRITPTKSAPMSIRSETAFMRTPPRTTPTRKAAPTSIPPRAAPKGTLLRSAPLSIPSKAELNSIPLKAVPSVLSPTKPWGRRESVCLLRCTTPTAFASLPAPPKPSGSRESLTKSPKTAISQSPRTSTPRTASSSLQEPAKQPLGSTKSMSEHLSADRKAWNEVLRHREIQKLRAAARQELEKVVRTVEFNDPYIDCTDVFK